MIWIQICFDLMSLNMCNITCGQGFYLHSFAIPECVIYKKTVNSMHANFIVTFFSLTWLQLFEQMLNHDFRLHIFCNITAIYWNGWICEQMGNISLIVAISFHVLIIDWFRYEQTLIILWPLPKITLLFGTLYLFFHRWPASCHHCTLCKIEIFNYWEKICVVFLL